MSDKHTGRDEVFLDMKMVGSGMLMVFVMVAVVGEIEVTGSIRTIGESSSISFRAENRCQEVISSLQKHADFGIVAFVSPSREGSGFHDSVGQKKSDRETFAADREILLPDLSVDVALKSKHEENEAYLFKRDLTESDRIVGELLQLGGYLKLIEFGLDDCVDGIEA
ncbi:squalene monooxygenase-like protein [Tanacetum coccineum]